MPKVIAIFIADKPGSRMQSVDSVEAVAGKGLRGDRNFRDPSDPKRDEPTQEITLIESESIEAAVRDYALSLDPKESRRNILTVGVALNHLVGRVFNVGSAQLRGLELCEPCSHLEKLTRKGVMRALIHRGGLRAQIIEGGTIRIGDAITS